MAAIGLDLSNLFVWGWMILMQCIHIFNMHEIAWIWNCIHKHHVSIWHCINVHVCFMHISMNLLYSTRLRGQKRKYNEGSTLWLSSYLRTAKQQWFPFVHNPMSFFKLPGVNNVCVFSRLFAEENVSWLMVAFFMIASISSHPWFHHDAAMTLRGTPAATMAVYSPKESPALEAAVKWNTWWVDM